MNHKRFFKAFACALIGFFALLFFSSCEEEESNISLPYARVRFEVDLNGKDSDLSVFGYKTFLEGRAIGEQTGYGGLLLFKNHQNDLFVYDLCCPYESNKNIRVTPRETGNAICPSCESVYVLMYGLGTPMSGPAKKPLQRYRVNPATRPGVYIITN